MATYFIGDIQSCFNEFKLLLAQIDFNHHRDTLYLVGDLIGRGPQPKETLDYLIAHQSSIHTVLGNHDLHFLAVAAGIKQNNPSNKFDPLLNSNNLATYVNYLRQQPLAKYLESRQVFISHAGLPPQWDIPTAMAQSKQVEQLLKSDHYQQLLQVMYGNGINQWNENASNRDKAVFTINALTRMRFCHSDYQLDFSNKLSPTQNDNVNLIPWFEMKHQLAPQQRLIFGHWASLMGKTNNPKYIALDTGCLWGSWLTCWQLENNHFFRQKSLQIC